VVAAFLIVVILALLPQIAFSICYWRMIPSWVNNPYGRLAQLGAWCHITFLTFYLVVQLFHKYFNVIWVDVIFISAFVPLILFGCFQLYLLKVAVRSAAEEKQKVEAGSEH